MSAVILDGKATAQKIKTNLIKRVQDLKSKGINPGLGTILVGDDAGSHAYVGMQMDYIQQILENLS